ncbi:MFS general substrate transporter [Dissoconium aciculare CBS 342.82]|uniref:MFS general substrate transporter n=1 Tax=Dissoconium aciculare CBS 342.82 TaxID=1314786 RepID=A0A6J3M465_9PEZI|nr:MFS general substrate transporter [Dissoconium aciculare CBS 342.82]KAF1822274.1 MFS general substrate transporter [Dissoconium aciculare CBS 342.82]
MEYCHAKDWSDERDAANPRNWSTREKVLSTLAFTFLAFVSTMAASIYSPGSSAVMTEFGITDELSILPISIYNLGLAFGPLIGAPLSETSGRKAVILLTTPAFALFTLGAGLSRSLGTLVICRFFAGVFAAPAISNASATITDYTARRHRGFMLTFYYAIPTFGAMLGPLLGGFVVLAKGWRWTQWTIIFFIVAAYVPVIFTRETYKKTILQRRARKWNIEGPPTPQRTRIESVKHFTTILLVRPVHMLLTEPVVTFVCLYCGFLFGLMYVFIVASPWVYVEYYGFGTVGQSLSFLGLICGTLFAVIPLITADTLLYQPKLAKSTAGGAPDAPSLSKYRLYMAMLASPLLPSFLLLFAWTARPSVHWICPIIFQGCAMSSSSMIYTTTNLFMMDTYGPLFGASAAAAAMLTRYALSTVFPLFSLRMYQSLGVGWASTILAGLALLMAPIPWVLYWRADKITQKIKYEVSN